MRFGLFLIGALFLTAIGGDIASAQNRATFTGSIMSFGSGASTRNTTRSFTLTITGVTSDVKAKSYLNALEEGGQNALLRAIDGEDFGTFMFAGQLGNPLGGVRVHDTEGKRIIRAFYARRIDIREVRSGYRSADYPFGYIELVVDPNTGRGDGTFIEAAQIRLRQDRQTGKETVEIESFATFPSRVMGVQLRGQMVQ